MQALFRLVNGNDKSEIYIGDCDITKMGLHSLRNKITIIPQTPFLFKATIR